MKDSMHKLLKCFCACSKTHDMEQVEEILERENKGKQNILIEKDEKLSKWTHLPSDIMEILMKNLKLRDYIGIRGVCSCWRATVTIAIVNKHCHPLPELPIVILRSRKRSVLPNRIFSISTEQECSLKSKSTLIENAQMCLGIVDGWMILCENLTIDTKTIVFLNPVSKDVVKVPSPLNLPSNSPILDRSRLCMEQMVASSSPKCEDCVVFGRFNDYANIAYCRVNTDKSWTMIEGKKEDIGNFVDMEFFNGKLYVRTVTVNNYMLVYDLQDPSDEPPKPYVLGNVPPIRPFPELSTHYSQTHVKGKVQRYLTRGYASEELLLIYLFYNSVYESDNVNYLKFIDQFVSQPQIIKLEVFKLDTSNNKWMKLDHLGDRVIFLGNYKSFIMSRATLNSTEELIAENSIYFALYFPCSKPWLNTQLGRLCLTDNSIKYFSLEQFGHELNVFPFWFLPSAW